MLHCSFERGCDVALFFDRTTRMISSKFDCQKLRARMQRKRKCGHSGCVAECDVATPQSNTFVTLWF